MFSYRKLIAFLAVIAWAGLATLSAQPRPRKPTKEVQPTSPNFNEPTNFTEKTSQMPSQDPRSPTSAQALTAPPPSLPPDNPPVVPLSGVGYLLALGGVYGAKKIINYRKRRGMP